MNFSETPEFKKDFKRLHKKYRSLPSDLRLFKGVISEIPKGNSRFFAHLKRHDDVTVIKTRLFCRYLKGRSLRIVYAYHQSVASIVFIELYAKKDKENEDRRRINSYLAGLL